MSGTTINSGSIGTGVLLTDGETLSNTSSGTITGPNYGVSGGTSATYTVINSGSIGGTATSSAGVFLQAGGLISNSSSATISGGLFGVDLTAVSATVINSGTIFGTKGSGIELYAGGLISNVSGGTIVGNYAGIDTSTTTSASVINAGGITGTAGSGIKMGAGGTVTNLLGGSIVEVDYGVVISGGAGSVDNYGSMVGTANAGVSLFSGGTVTNQIGGYIGGYTGVGIAGGAGTLINLGTIGATGNYAVRLSSGYANRLVIGPGATFTGTVTGGNTVGATSASTLELTTGASIGTLTGLGQKYVDFTNIIVDPSAFWELASGNTLAAGYTFTDSGSLINAGILTETSNSLQMYNGVLLNAGGATITGGGVAGTTGVNVIVNGGTIINNEGGFGVDLGSGLVINQSGATISGGGTADSVALADPGTVNNQGYLLGGIQLLAGGSVTNQSGGTITAIAGGDGVYLTTTPGGAAYLTNLAGGAINAARYGIRVANATVVNQGSVSGGSEGIFGSNGVATVMNGGTITGGGTNATGVDLTAGGYVSNATTGSIGGNRTGVYVSAAGTVINSGSISGANYVGVFLSAGGGVSNATGASIQGANAGVEITGIAGTVTNQGTVTAASTGVDLVDGGVVSNVSGGTIAGGTFGVVLSGGGSLTNASGGVINGGSYGVRFVASAGTIENAGSIGGTSAGARAIYLASGFTNLLVDDPGASFTGFVDGGNAVGASFSSTLELAAAGVVGTLSGLGSKYIDFSSVVVDPGANWAFSGANTIVAGQTLTLAGAMLNAGATLVNNGAIQLDPSTLTVGDLTGTGTVTLAGPEMLDLGQSSTQAIAGFSGTDTLDVTSLPFVTGAHAIVQAGTLDVSSGGTVETFALSGVPDGTQYQVVSDAGASAVVACFAEGTRIHTERGAVKVEDLSVGERVPVILGDGFREIVWIGHRPIDCDRHPDPASVWPVRIARGAFGPGLPSDDLLLSPDHAVWINDVLIPVRCLINGTTIAQMKQRHVTYYHVELPAHDVILAEGLPVESYLDLDLGDRANFHQAGTTIRLFPDFASRVDPGTAEVWETRGAARLVVTGPELTAARALVASARQDRQPLADLAVPMLHGHAHRS